MRIAITTLGCKVNQYDTAVMERLFGEKGWTQVDFREHADAYVVNSCTVTDRADSEARRLARRARRTNADARVIMTGCYAQTSPTEIAELDYVDYIIGLGRLPELLGAVAGEMNERIAISDLRKATEVGALGISSFSGRTRAFVKVQEGCNLFCTFCIVPVARGRSRSVSPRLVLEELERLVAKGFREVVLTGIHLGGYGDDLDPAIDLAGLLECIVERDLPLRIRVSSVDPPELTERFVKIVSESGHFCPHFHIPLQAGVDTVLERMRRKYNTKEAGEALDRLRNAFPNTAIGTDVITGFPGETEEEFERGIEWIDAQNFAYLHVFPYSQRQSTAAAKRWTPLADSLVHDRARRMRELDGQLRRRYRTRFLGERASVLVENSRDPKSTLLRGHTEHYVPVEFEGPDGLMNQVVDVVLGNDPGKERLAARLL
ncbi:MAG: threonylcarbamoyladenosine tRNA methylthiotransferase MtaB [Hyphomicrobiaceae bacterium]|jgi:threonylcarbamoyladenosine tRNA methylthiotransferase MtaB